MPVTDINHYMIRAVDLADTRHFYVDVLGFEEMPRPPFPFPGYWFGVNGGVQVHVAAQAVDHPDIYYLGTPANAPDDNSGVIDHVAFAATDHQEMLARLQAHDVKFRARYLSESSLYQLFVRDPNGVTVELNFFGVTEVAGLEGAEDYTQMPTTSGGAGS